MHQLSLTSWIKTLEDRISINLPSEDIFIQAATILGLLLVVLAASLPLQRVLKSRFSRVIAEGSYQARGIEALIKIVPYLILLLLLAASAGAFARFGLSNSLYAPIQTLLITWIAIRAASSLITNRFWFKLFAIVLFSLAILYILGFLGPAVKLLDSFGFTLGNFHLSLWSFLKALTLLLVLLKLGLWCGDFLERKLEDTSALTPSSRVLLNKLIKISVFILVFVIALNSVGLDLTALAVFSGGVGIGIGFGLQKVVANLISGIILLVDKSIKPGDVIEIGDVFGWISELRARYASVVTRDGKEYLIPNEQLITNQVINWSFSNRNIRLKVPIGISYESDPNQAIKLVVEAARKTRRVLHEPKPVCRLMGFGDNSVDLELRFWIDDPRNGITNVRSNVLLEIWEAFHQNGISIPFPQRDVHLDVQSFSDPLKVENISTSQTLEEDA